MPEPIEHIETPQEITDAEISAFLGDTPEPDFHPILEVWQEVLAPISGEKTKKVTPQWASRITSSFREINFADMPDFQRRFYNILEDLASVIAAEVETDRDCLKVATPAEDAELNAHHYKNVLLGWQQTVLLRELEWDCTDPGAACELAAISEAHKMFFGPTGLTSFLDQINFEFTEADQAQLAEALEDVKASAGE